MEKKEDFLVTHYTALNDLRTDFRNHNLFTLVVPLVMGRNVIDIGCGSGFFASMLMEQGKEVIGIEPNEEMRKLAEKINPEVHILAGKAEDVNGLITKPVDTVVMIDVLEHVADDVVQVQKVRTTLTDAGGFVIVVPAYPFLYGERDKGMGHYRRYTHESLQKVLTDNGFAVTSMRYWNALGVLPYLVSEKVLKKPLQVGLRGGAKVGVVGGLVRKCLYLWFKYIENNWDFGFGLSIIVVARKI